MPRVHDNFATICWHPPTFHRHTVTKYKCIPDLPIRDRPALAASFRKGNVLFRFRGDATRRLLELGIPRFNYSSVGTAFAARARSCDASSTVRHPLVLRSASSLLPSPIGSIGGLRFIFHVRDISRARTNSSLALCLFRSLSLPQPPTPPRALTPSRPHALAPSRPRGLTPSP